MHARTRPWAAVAVVLCTLAVAVHAHRGATLRHSNELDSSAPERRSVRVYTGARDAQRAQMNQRREEILESRRQGRAVMEEGEQCFIYEDCASCTADSECGWCESAGAAFCVGIRDDLPFDATEGSYEVCKRFTIGDCDDVGLVGDPTLLHFANEDQVVTAGAFVGEPWLVAPIVHVFDDLSSLVASDNDRLVKMEAFTSSGHPVVLLGDTEVEVENGVAVFDHVIAISNATSPENRVFFNFTSKPPLAPAQSTDWMTITAGAPVLINVTGLAVLTETDTEGFPIAATESSLGLQVNARDAFGNAATNGASAQLSDDIGGEVTGCLPHVNVTCTFWREEDDLEITLGCKKYVDVASETLAVPLPDRAGDLTIKFETCFFHPSNEDGGEPREFSKFIDVTVRDRGEVGCYSAMTNVAKFEADMISKAVKNDISDALFSEGKPRKNVVEFIMSNAKEVPTYHRPVAPMYARWGLAQKHFYTEVDVQLLEALSFKWVTVTSASVKVPLEKAFCSNVNDEEQRLLFNAWLWKLSNDAARFRKNAPADVEVRAPDDQVCYLSDTKRPGIKRNLLCCDRILTDATKCSRTKVSELTEALFAMSVVFAFLTAMYIVTVVVVYVRETRLLSGQTEMQYGLTLDERAKAMRKYMLLVFISAFPLTGALVHIVLSIDDEVATIVSSILYSIIVLLWYGAGFQRARLIFSKVVPPTRVQNTMFLIGGALTALCTFFSFGVCFAWVCLGMILDPDRMMTAFVSLCTILMHVFVKLRAMNKAMDKMEHTIRAKILEQDPEDLSELGVGYYGRRLEKFLRVRGYKEETIQRLMSALVKYRRFRGLFIMSTLVSSTFLLVILIVFILLGMNAFKKEDGQTANVTSLLVVVSGAGVNQQEESEDDYEYSRRVLHRMDKKSEDDEMSEFPSEAPRDSAKAPTRADKKKLRAQRKKEKEAAAQAQAAAEAEAQSLSMRPEGDMGRGSLRRPEYMPEPEMAPPRMPMRPGAGMDGGPPMGGEWEGGYDERPVSYIPPSRAARDYPMPGSREFMDDFNSYHHGGGY